MQSPPPQNENSRLESLRGFRVLETPREPLFDDIVRLATIVCDASVGKIGFVDQHRVWFKAKIGLEFDEIPRERSFSAQVILRSDILIVPDPLADAAFANNFLVTEAGIRFLAGIPLVTSNHQAIGALAVMDRVPHLLTAEQIDCLQILARRIIYELELRYTREVQLPHPGPILAPRLRRSATILLVEDNDNLRNLLQRALEADGVSVLSAVDGADALRTYREHDGAIDLVVSDIVMPNLNGIELSERIRATRPEMKFLFITSFGDQIPELRDRIKHSATILEKPFLPSELLRRVEAMLNQGKAATGTDGA
jgi:CheY-like chemotaxis protein